MVYVIICGIIVGMIYLMFDPFADHSFVPSRTFGSSHLQKPKIKNHVYKDIVREIYNDLIQLFYYKTRGKFIGPLDPLNNVTLLDNLILVEDNESFTINKKIIHLCTKDPKTGDYYDKNTLMFVVLHELAHVLCDDVGHTDKFSTINQALLNHAITHKYYDPSKPFIKNYCPLLAK